MEVFYLYRSIFIWEFFKQPYNSIEINKEKSTGLFSNTFWGVQDAHILIRPWIIESACSKRFFYISSYC